MAFENKNLILLQPAGDRGSLFLYQAGDDNKAAVAAENYFDGALGIPAQLRDKDVIIAVCADGPSVLAVTVAAGHVTTVAA